MCGGSLLGLGVAGERGRGKGKQVLCGVSLLVVAGAGGAVHSEGKLVRGGQVVLGGGSLCGAPR